jgi:hypothetical protein
MKEHSKSHALLIANYACQSKSHFRELIQCFLDEENKIAQRAAWSVRWAAKTKPEMMYVHIKDLVQVLQRQNVHDAVIRNSVRVLQDIDIPKKYHGEVMEICFLFLQKPLTPVAIKVFSLTTLFNLSKLYPEIRPELKMSIEDSWEHGTAGFRSRAKKILPKL